MIKDDNNDMVVSRLQQLVAAGNDTKAFERIYLILYNDLHYFAYRIIKSNHIAEEIVADVFVMLWKKRNEFEAIKNLRVFLYVAIKNQALTYLYKAKKQKVCWIEEFANEPEMLSEESRPDELLIGKEVARDLQQAIKNLPDKCKAVFKLVKEDRLKYAQAARVLNLSIKTVENQMGIALRKIAHAMKLSAPVPGKIKNSR